MKLRDYFHRNTRGARNDEEALRRMLKEIARGAELDCIWKSGFLRCPGGFERTRAGLRRRRNV